MTGPDACAAGGVVRRRWGALRLFLALLLMAAVRNASATGFRRRRKRRLNRIGAFEMASSLSLLSLVARRAMLKISFCSSKFPLQEGDVVVVVVVVVVVCDKKGDDCGSVVNASTHNGEIAAKAIVDTIITPVFLDFDLLKAL